MRYEDWRLATPAEVLPLLEREAARWALDLRWDISAGVKAAEDGRRSGRVRDGRRIVGGAGGAGGARRAGAWT